MSEFVPYSTDEIKVMTTINCCANAVIDSIPRFGKLAKRDGFDYSGKLAEASRLLSEIVQHLMEIAPDEDQREMIWRRMRGLKLQFGHVAKHPDNLVWLDVNDANTLLAPLLDNCDIACPCTDDSLTDEQKRACVKQCETRKALRRLGVQEDGLSSECPYQWMIGR